MAEAEWRFTLDAEFLHVSLLDCESAPAFLSPSWVAACVPLFAGSALQLPESAPKDQRVGSDTGLVGT